VGDKVTKLNTLDKKMFKKCNSGIHTWNIV